MIDVSQKGGFQMKDCVLNCADIMKKEVEKDKTAQVISFLRSYSQLIIDTYMNSISTEEKNVSRK